jgi:hypothetical protein
VSELDDLPPDQRAVLSLVLRQRKAYGEVAAMLNIDVAAVAGRATAALTTVGPETGFDDELREDLVDYLLGQQSASGRAQTREALEGSHEARLWARQVAAVLRPIAGDELPEIPADPGEVDEAFEALQQRGEAREPREQTSRLGGGLMLGALGVAVAAIVVFVIVGVGSGSSSNSSTSSTSSGAGTNTAPAASPTAPASTTPASTNQASTTPSGATAPTSTGSSTTGKTQVEGTLTLVPAQRGGSAKGEVVISRQGSQKAIALVGQGLPPTNGFAYAVWLYSSESDAQALGFAGKVSSDGKLAPVAAYLPANVRHFKEIVVTRETSNPPKKPGPIVLSAGLPANV